jgi:beta-glucanase (GH16 family)
MGLRVKSTWLVVSIALTALIVGLATVLGAQAAPTLICGHLKERKTKELVRTEARKLQLLERRGMPMRDPHHRFRYCVRKKVVPPDPPPPGDDVLPKGGPGGNWNLKFHDEFSGSSLNTAKWVNENSAGRPNYGPQGGTAYRPSNATVGGGQLNIDLDPNQSYAGSPHTGARIDTFGKYGFTYGYLEFRAKMPDHDGSWAALWTNADSHPGPGPDWPANGEFDVLETLGDNNSPRIWVHEGATQGSTSDRPWSGGGRTFANANTAWHTYAMAWEPNQVRFYYDGDLVSTFSPSTSGGWVPSAPHHVIVELKSLNAGSPPPPDSMQVDYVRVWQR